MERKTPTDAELTGLLRRFYGYDSFRPRQADIIRTICSGRDCVVLMPTGGGKSICYQIPALFQPGIAVVVSPLIALMEDQVQGLRANGIPAAALHSNQTEAQNCDIIDAVRKGRIKLLYISPERLLLEIENWPLNIPVSLFAIDEAHCISQWGHDFRPEYTQLARIKELFPAVPVIALTATADKLTRDDIAKQLRLRDPEVFISSFDRPNISLTVKQNPGKAHKLKLICDMIDRYADDSGIIYCLSRKNVESLATELSVKGYKTTVYHAGLTPQQRADAQRRFINGDMQVMCATIAFGMGIDKSNIRYVIHNNLPKNIESYYQEIGRAGRDGLPAEALMFYSFQDIITLESFIAEGGMQEINREKLARMREYAEASVCRRRILLSYFSEECTTDCGNCDVCRQPPLRFDGTIAAQKALSAIIRAGKDGKDITISLLIDILRGSARAEIISRGLDKIKTYGVGREYGPTEWKAYIAQLMQLGLIEIAYNDGNKLNVTPQGWRVVRGEQPVTLARFIYERHRTAKEKKTKKTTSAEPLSEGLLRELKSTRSALAKIQGCPPYIICSDKTLRDIARKMPEDRLTFSNVFGIGEFKTERLWEHFTRVVRQWKQKNPQIL